MVGGVLADRYERKKVILLARGTCGIGFIGLCLNALLPEPSLLEIYLLGLWDGFFASLGVTALLAATPALVGRENLMQAGAITMLTVRLGSVISPMRSITSRTAAISSRGTGFFTLCSVGVTKDSVSAKLLPVIPISYRYKCSFLRERLMVSILLSVMRLEQSIFLACGRQVHRNAAHGKGQSAALRRCPHPVPRFLHRRVGQSHDIKAGKSLRNVALRRDGAALYSGDTQRSDAAGAGLSRLLGLVNLSNT